MSTIGRIQAPTLLELIARILFSLIILAPTAALANTIVVVCTSNQHPELAPSKFTIDLDKRTADLDGEFRSQPVEITEGSISWSRLNSAIPGGHGVSGTIDRVTGVYTLRQCDGGECSREPSSWTTTQTFQCRAGVKQF